jgi:hypothetical protein
MNELWKNFKRGDLIYSSSFLYHDEYGIVIKIEPLRRRVDENSYFICWSNGERGAEPEWWMNKHCKIVARAKQ